MIILRPQSMMKSAPLELSSNSFSTTCHCINCTSAVSFRSEGGTLFSRFNAQATVWTVNDTLTSRNVSCYYTVGTFKPVFFFHLLHKAISNIISVFWSLKTHCLKKITWLAKVITRGWAELEFRRWLFLHVRVHVLQCSWMRPSQPVCMAGKKQTACDLQLTRIPKAL